ncbi:LppM family (lipo)protein [Myceligenerans salitolerans]|uniref:LppM domain-containing protein n=1 Tax=Myceligenerans salitolerans TaxID=1230528 RepID=A0ABS3I9L3_9MICO|nr:hypothetical protein [Myceligenerans salitolerans]MBO0609717.1 hypothetical protein [Myceligenerans salitolerans]
MTRRPRTTRRLAAAAAVVLALALSGCVRMGLELELAPDDVARPSLVLAVEDRVLDGTGRSAEDFLDTMVGGNDPADTAVRVEDWAADGYTGERYVYGEVNTRRINAATDLPLNVVREGDEYVVTGTLDLTAEGLGMDGRASLDDVELVVDISFPGPVTESNGVISGDSVHWEPPLGEPYEIHARGAAVDPAVSSPAPETSTTAPAGTTTPAVPDWLVAVLGAGGLVILLLLAIVVWQALRVRKGNDTDPPGAAVAPSQGPYPPHGYVPPGQPQHHGAPVDPHRPPSIPPRG